MAELTATAFDIETTGFQTGNKLTVVGFDSVVSSRVFLHTETTPQAGLANRLNDTIQIPKRMDDWIPHK